MPSADPASLIDTSIVDVTVGLKQGTSSMAMNWPFMWSSLQDDPAAATKGQFATALLPAGDAGTASLDGSDAWTVTADSPVKDLAYDLIEFYLDPGIQKQQALATGWLPIRRSLFTDAEILAALPQANGRVPAVDASLRQFRDARLRRRDDRDRLRGIGCRARPENSLTGDLRRFRGRYRHRFQSNVDLIQSLMGPSCKFGDNH